MLLKLIISRELIVLFLSFSLISCVPNLEIDNYFEEMKFDIENHGEFVGEYITDTGLMGRGLNLFEDNKYEFYAWGDQVKEHKEPIMRRFGQYLVFSDTLILLPSDINIDSIHAESSDQLIEKINSLGLTNMSFVYFFIKYNDQVYLISISDKRAFYGRVSTTRQINSFFNMMLKKKP